MNWSVGGILRLERSGAAGTALKGGVARPVYIAFVIAFALLSVMFVAPVVIEKARWVDQWLVPDWMISYDAGFVRRGLLGQIIYTISDLTGVAPQYVLAAVYLTAYVALTALLAVLFCMVRHPAAILALVFAPFMFLFEPRLEAAVLRKETLFLLLVAVLAIAHVRRKPGKPAWAAEAALCAMPLLVLVHEMFFLYSPYVLIFAALSAPDRDRWIRLAGLWGLSGVAFLAALTFHGDVDVTARLCQNFVERIGKPETINACLGEGPIQALSQKTKDAYHQLTVEYGQEMARILPVVLLLVLVAFLPLAPFFKAMHQARPMQLRAIQVCVAAAVVLTLPLFAFAVDWGRFVRIHAVAAAIVVTALVARAQAEQWPGATDSPIRVMGAPAYLGFVVLYSTSWALYHLAPLIGPGLLGSVLAKLF